MDLQLVQARWVLGHIPSAEVPRIAGEALEAGFDTPALRQLAGEKNPIMSDVGPVFERAFKELGKEPLARESAGQVIARWWARSILRGDSTPYEGAKAIWSEVCDPLGDGGELFVFKALASEHEDYQFVRSSNPEAYDLKVRECEANIIQAAEFLLSKDG